MQCIHILVVYVVDTHIESIMRGVIHVRPGHNGIGDTIRGIRAAECEIPEVNTGESQGLYCSFVSLLVSLIVFVNVLIHIIESLP